MTVKECYEKLNGNYEDVKKRLTKDEVIEMIMLQYPADKSMLHLKNAVASGDIKASFENAHEMKGVVSNLGFTALWNAISALTEQLRSMSAPADPGLYKAVEEQYALVINTLQEY